MLLDAIFGRRRASTHGSGDVLQRFLDAGLWSSSRTTAGAEVTEEIALTYAAWWCGCRILAEAVASLPLLTYRREGKDDRETAADHWLFDLLWRQPNPDMPTGPFREGRVLHQINWGNGFAEIEWDDYRPERRTRALALWPIHPSRVKAVSDRYQQDLYKSGYRYLVRNNDGSQFPFRADEMLHVPGIFPEDGIWGKSAVEYHRETIGFGLATERHGAEFFGDGAQPAGILVAPGMKDPENRKNFRKEWKEIHSGTSEIAILPPESSFTPLTMSNESAQYLETRRFNVAQVARILRIPVYMLEEYEKAASYASVEMRGIDFIVYSLMPWLRRWEEQINMKLILPQDRETIFVEHLLAGLLRGDFQSRMDGYVKALGNGILTINEVRRLENQNGIGPAGDQHYVPLNMTTAERMLQDDQIPDARTPLPPDQTEADQLDQMAQRLIGRSKPWIRAVPGEAVQQVIADGFSRVFGKLANALKREAGKVTDLSEWLKAFAAKHADTFAEALAPTAAVLDWQKVGGKTLLEKVQDKAAADLGPAFDTMTPKQFADLLAEWPRRAAGEVAAELTQEVNYAP